jgi:hypothetical protein
MNINNIIEELIKMEKVIDTILNYIDNEEIKHELSIVSMRLHAVIENLEYLKIINMNRIERIINKLKELDKMDVTPLTFCLDCEKQAIFKCIENNHFILHKTTDCCEFCDFISIINWLREKGYLKHE